MPAQAFESPADLSDHQAQRELVEALMVRRLDPAARGSWLAANWGSLQAQASILVAQDQAASARCFANMADKNRYDEAREIDQALALALARRQT